MHAKSISNGSAIILLVTTGLPSMVNGRLAGHGHQHRDVIGRIMRNPVASSGSSFLITATRDPIVILPIPVQTGVDDGCFGDACGSLNATHLSEVFSHITPVPQVQNGNLELRDDPVATQLSRRRQHFRALLQGEKVSTVFELESVVSGTLTTDSPMTSASALPTFPTPLEIGASRNLDNISTEGAEPHGFSTARSHDLPNPLAPRQDSGYQSFVLGGFSSPASTTAAVVSTVLSTSPSTPSASGPASSICPASDGTTYTSSDGINYQVDCNTDYTDNNLQFQLVGSFAGCVQKCDAWNFDHHQVQCVAALFIPNRDVDADDCYLKSKLVDPSAASLIIEGAIRIGYATATTSQTASSISSAISSSRSTLISSSIALSSTPSSTAATTSASSVSSPGITYGSGGSVIVPKVASSHLQGPIQNTPSQQYLDIEAPAGIKLASSLLKVGVNGNLTTGYDISAQTGVLEVNISTQSHVSPLKDTPHLSRDGGRGGIVNGEHLFVFCDTGSYSTTTSTSDGKFLGFVSSSVAIDVGMKGLTGGALNLQDGIGEWSDDVGRMRGFAPLTEGEMAYNQAMQGQGQRYAVWPESDIIPLDATTGIIYAPIVYDNVNQLTKAAVFTYTGATLLTISAGGKGGPVAERTVGKIFQQNEIEWGCAGGIRSWGPSGIGGNDGSVYIFGNVAGGILLGRTSPAKIADVTAIQYWNGKSWTNEMLTSTSTAYFIAGAFMDINVFYSPRHLTFIVVYLTIYADSTFYYRYLDADQGILPPFAPGGDASSDYVENILKYKWSEQQILYKAAQGLSGKYIYSGGPHLGYYGSNDIAHGGSKMLLSWTAPTGLDPSTLTSEYQIITAEIDWA